MNPDPNYQRLREIGWRRPLTEAEQAEVSQWLAAHPEHQAEAEADAALTQIMAKLPEAPIPSNFTARVLQSIQREEQGTERTGRRTSNLWWRRLIPRFGIAAVVLGLSGISYWRYQVRERAELVGAAEKFVSVAGTGALSDPAVLEDFDVIRQLGQADDGLLALSDDLLSLQQ